LNTTIRPLFLLGSVGFFGFYNGGCPFFITRENLFEQIDPFRIAFNMTSRYPFGWVLLGFLLLSSLFIYRPFCNGACPVGLVLGFIEKVPWAVAMRKNSNCIECGRCTVTCSSRAISKNEAVRQEVCIMCGDCMEACRENGIFPSTSKYEKPQAVFPTTTVSAGA
jgi:polyferredoxin